MTDDVLPPIRRHIIEFQTTDLEVHRFERGKSYLVVRSLPNGASQAEVFAARSNIGAIISVAQEVGASVVGSIVFDDNTFTVTEVPAEAAAKMSRASMERHATAWRDLMPIFTGCRYDNVLTTLTVAMRNRIGAACTSIGISFGFAVEEPSLMAATVSLESLGAIHALRASTGPLKFTEAEVSTFVWALEDAAKDIAEMVRVANQSTVENA